MPITRRTLSILKKTFITHFLLIGITLSLSGKDIVRVNTVDADVILSQATDYCITSSETFGNGSVELNHPDAWLILENIRPQTFLDNYAGKVTINGQPLNIQKDIIPLENASIPSKKDYKILNARVQVYRHGTVIIPHTNDSYNALTVYTEKDYTGKSLNLKSGNRYNELNEFDNAIKSIKLKRGYMATLATEPDGKGFSRVFVADTEDIDIPLLPHTMLDKVSCISIFNWQWPSKKGWCSAGKNAYNEIDITESTWYYSWGADWPVFPNQEYVAIKHNPGWPSIEEIHQRTDITHLLGFNEPDRPEQANATVAQAISGWEDLMATGLRLGSPGIADNLNWLYSFIDECDKRNYRVDFVAVHAYWGGAGGAYNVLTNGKVDVKKWYNRLKEIHERTGRPLWITEWNNGANWTINGEPYWDNDPVKQQLQNEKILKDVLHMLDTCRFVERYSIYNWVSDRKALVEGKISQPQIDASRDTKYPIPQANLGKYTADGWVEQRLTPAGVTYRDRYPAFAFNPELEVIHNFTPTIPVVRISCERTGQVRISTVDYNGEMVESYEIERKINDSDFEPIANGKVIPQDYYDDILPIVTDFTKLTYRIRLLVNGQEMITDPLSLTIGMINGEQPVRAVSANFNTTSEQFFFIKQPFEEIPVVITGGMSYAASLKTLVTEVYNVNKHFFNYRIAPWNYNTAVTMNIPEKASCLAANEGAYKWGDLKVEARIIPNLSTYEGWVHVEFTEPFEKAPVIFAHSQTQRDYPCVVRVRDVTTSGFDMHITREQQFSNNIRVKVAWFAIEPGSTEVDNKKIKVGTVENVGEVNKKQTIEFGESLKNPAFLTAIQTSNDDHTYGVRYMDLTATDVSVFKQIEKSKGDPATSTKKEDTLGYIVVEQDPSSTSIEGTPQEKPGLLIYPTVTDELLYILNKENIQVDIFNISGSLVKKTVTNGNALDVGNLQNGMYILRVTTGEVGKFIKR